MRIGPRGKVAAVTLGVVSAAVQPARATLAAEVGSQEVGEMALGSRPSERREKCPQRSQNVRPGRDQHG